MRFNMKALQVLNISTMCSSKLNHQISLAVLHCKRINATLTLISPSTLHSVGAGDADQETVPGYLQGAEQAVQSS